MKLAINDPAQKVRTLVELGDRPAPPFETGGMGVKHATIGVQGAQIRTELERFLAGHPPVLVKRKKFSLANLKGLTEPLGWWGPTVGETRVFARKLKASNGTVNHALL